MKRRTVLFVFLCSAILILGAASFQAAASTKASNPTAVFTYVSNQPIIQGSWDPGTSYGEEVSVLANVYEGLTRYNSVTRKAEPLLATSWSATHGGRDWTFHLRKGVTFHTGRPFNSMAAKASILRTKKLGQAASYIWSSVKQIQTPDASTLVFKLSYPAPMNLIAASSYSAWMYDTQAAGSGSLAHWFAKGQDAGTGPYTVAQWNKGAELEVRLKPYSTYWGGWSGKHYDAVAFRVAPTASTAIQLLKAGQVSFVAQPDPQQFAALKSDPSLRTSEHQSFVNYFLLLNTQRAPLTDVRVRQALAYAVNYPGIEAVLHGSAQRTSGELPPGLLGSTNDLVRYSYQPKKAASLLAAAGYGPKGKPINLTLTYVAGDVIATATAQLVQSTFAPLNVKVNLEALQFPALQAKFQGPASQRQDIVINTWYPDYPDAYSWFVNVFKSKAAYNSSYYSNPTIDKEMEQAERDTGTNPNAATALYRKMQETLLKDIPAIPTDTQVFQRAMLSSVHGFVENPLYFGVVFVYQLKP